MPSDDRKADERNVHPLEQSLRLEPYRIAIRFGVLLLVAFSVLFAWLWLKQGMAITEFAQKYGVLFFLSSFVVPASPLIAKYLSEKGAIDRIKQTMNRIVKHRFYFLLMLFLCALWVVAFILNAIVQNTHLEWFLRILLWLIGGIGSVAYAIYHMFPESAALDAENRARRSQKERVCVLTAFAPKMQSLGLMKQRNVYDRTLEMLGRIPAEDSENGDKHEVCMLLCTPLFDYVGNKSSHTPTLNSAGQLPNGQRWGYEFAEKLEDLSRRTAKDSGFTLSLAYLSKYHAGFRPRDDFHEVLSRYISEKNGDESAHTLGLAHLRKREEEVLGKLEAQCKDNPRLHLLDHLVDIPFQIFLVVGSERNEAIICFAGREVLEQGDGNHDAQGLYTSDPYVVETLYRVYKTYVGVRTRIPYVPEHTQKVMTEQSALSSSGPYELRNVLGRSGVNLKVNPGVFSPATGNSSKFSAWCIEQHLTKNDLHVLEIGAGTGILTCVAFDRLRELHTNTQAKFSVTALEPTKAGFDNLRANQETVAHADARFRTIRGGMFISNGTDLPKFASTVVEYSVEDYGPCSHTVGIFTLNEASESIEGAAQFKGSQLYNLIIADLPFTNANHTDDPTTHAYFDPQHREQHCLFRLISASSNLLAQDGRLLTSFSSLGGTQDVIRFERMFEKFGLRAIVRHDFLEAGYAWYVYLLVKSDSLKDGANRQAGFVPNSYWEAKLGIQKPLLRSTDDAQARSEESN